jgi:hypothetical protein
LKTPYLGAEVTPEVLSGLETKVVEMRQLLSFAVGLTPTDRRRYQALGRQRVQFVKLTLDNLQQNPGLVPPFLDSEEIQLNYQLYQRMLNIQESLGQIVQMVDDTVHTTGALAASDALDVYSTVKRAAKANTPGAKSLEAKLKASLKAVPKTVSTTPSATANAASVA